MTFIIVVIVVVALICFEFGKTTMVTLPTTTSSNTTADAKTGLTDHQTDAPKGDNKITLYIVVAFVACVVAIAMILLLIVKIRQLNVEIKEHTSQFRHTFDSPFHVKVQNSTSDVDNSLNLGLTDNDVHIQVEPRNPVPHRHCHTFAAAKYRVNELTPIES